MRFARHGLFDIKVTEDVMLVDAEGPFNQECIVDYHNAINTCINSFGRRAWKQVINLTDQSLMTPCAEEKLYKSVIDRKGKGLEASAIVIPTLEKSNLVTNQMARIYNKATLRCNFFNTKEAALEWLSTIE